MALLLVITGVALWVVLDLWLGINLNNFVKSKLKPVKVK